MTLSDILLSFADLSINYFEIFDSYDYYRKPIQDYKNWRKNSKIDSGQIYQLKKHNLISISEEEAFITEKGLEKIRLEILNNITIKIPRKWDERWRIVIFDIPEEIKVKRELFRRMLIKLGFVPIQKSVFCFPHPCLEEIMAVLTAYDIKKFVTYFEASEIITGKNIIKIFQDKELF